IEVAQLRLGLPRFRKPSAESMACRRYDQQRQIVRLLPQGFLRPGRRVVVSLRNEMSEGSSTLHSDHVRIERAQSHAVSEMIDRKVRLAAPNPDPAARIPCSREIRIEHERAINKRDASIYVAGSKSNRMGGTREGDRIVRPQLRGSP